MSEQHSHDHNDEHQSHDHDGIGGEYLTTFTSVGIDIGSSTSHLTFSRHHIGSPSLQRRHPEVLERKVISRSSVLLTPFTQDWSIQMEPLTDPIRTAYGQAGFTPEHIDTGAVIVNGNAARRSNARRFIERPGGAAMFMNREKKIMRRAGEERSDGH